MIDARILGPIEVVGANGQINLGGPQQRRVMAALLSDPGRVLTFDRLSEVLWSGRDEPAGARSAAFTYVSRLRSAVGDGVIETTDAGYVLTPSSVRLDADHFTTLLDRARTVPAAQAIDVLDEALGLWRGPVFGDLTGEWWALPLTNKLTELRLAALAHRVEALAADGWDGRAVAEATMLVDAYPLREQYTDLAIRGLHLTGRTADALRIFHRHRSALIEQSGLEPSTDLTELERLIASGEEVQTTSNEGTRRQRGYVLHELLGEGSFGSVYRATQPGVQRDVALKVIRRELADDRSFVHRFEAEAQLIARLEHPHIVALYDYWREPGGAFLAFRLLRGGTALERLQRDGPFSIDTATRILDEIGSALSAAHSAHVIHRDVKPANILFDEAGAAYLTDFGIAATAGGHDGTPPPWSGGSLLYASPEQLRDGVDDPRADQYSLAVTVWELLTGRPPFVGEDFSAVVSAKVRDNLPLVSDVRHDIPVPLADVLARAASSHPADRFSGVEAFVMQWRRALTGVTDPALITDPFASPGTHHFHRSNTQTMATSAFGVTNPYKGLRPFREADFGDFYGRRDLVSRLVKTVAESPFTAVVGSSGSGKSSAVLAGLVPRIRDAGALVAVLTPGDDPIASLSQGLAPIARAAQADDLTTAALRQPGGIQRAIATIADTDRLVLVIDQFEELWTLSDDSDRRLLCSALVDVGATGPCAVVVTIRADLFDRPLSDPTLGSLVAEHAFAVTPMTADEVHEAIAGPAERVGVRFDPALIGRLVAETLDQPGMLPLLQFTLAELFEGRQGATITSDGYDQIGGIAGALSKRADEIYESLDAADRAATHRLFTRLVTPGEGHQDTRRRVPIRELAGVPDHVIQAFVARRLLTTDHDATTREGTVELAHEVLLRSWSRLVGWLHDDRTWLRELRSMSVAAAQWDAGGRDLADLYRGGRLAVVTELAVTRGGDLTERERAFLDASGELDAFEHRQAEQRLADKSRQNRRLRRALTGVAAGLVLAVVAGSVAFNQRGAATAAREQAQSSEVATQLGRLASRSLNLRSTERDLAALLAVEAWRRSPDATAKSALFGTFTFDPGFLGYLPVEDTFQLLGRSIASTSMALVTGSRDEPGEPILMPRIMDVVTGEVVRTFEPLIPVADDAVVHPGIDVEVSRNGRFAAVRMGPDDATTPPVVGIYDVSTGLKIGPTFAVAAATAQMAVSDDGRTVATSSKPDGVARIYGASGELRATIPAVEGAPTSPLDAMSAAVAFAPDGRLFVGSQGTRLRVFDPTTLEMVSEIKVPVSSTSGDLQFSNDGSVLMADGLLTGAGEVTTGALVRVDPANGSVTWQISGDQYRLGECSSMAFDQASNRLWCANYPGPIIERSLSTGDRTGQTLQNQRGWIRRLEMINTATGPMLVSYGQNYGAIGRWGIGGNGPIQRGVAAGHELVSMIDDHTLLVGTDSGRDEPFRLNYQLWDSETDTKVADLPHVIFARSVGDLIYGVLDDYRFFTYNANSKQETSYVYSDLDTVVAASASADGSVIMVGHSDGRAVALSPTGDHLIEVQVPLESGFQPPVHDIQISADRSRLYVAALGSFAFNGANGKLLATGEHGPGTLLVTSRGELVAADYNGRMYLLDPETLADVGTLPGSSGFIHAMRRVR